ncbi:MAG: NAD+ synthase [Zetaproteobacteria bacterium]|nr:NAD+ synthase [Zetaproteobacteria bacterium]
MKVMLAQCAPLVGDMRANVAMILEHGQRAADAGCDLVVFPELMLCGYPPEDLLLRPAFVQACEVALQEVVDASGDVCLVFGAPRKMGNHLFNSAFVVRHGEILGVYDKQSLPNYGVFDEQRYFHAGDGLNTLFMVDDWRIGIGICEDAWHDDLVEKQRTIACDVWLNLNASPFHVDKQLEREALMLKRAEQMNAPMVYVNAIGGQDEVVFDGGSHVAMPASNQGIILRAPLFEPAAPVLDLCSVGQRALASLPETIAQIHQALVMGVRDYVCRNGCWQVVLGLSGGIDSAVTAAIAVEALGCENVLGVLLPSKYSSDHAMEDALSLASLLNIETIHLPIHCCVDAVESALQPSFQAWNKTKLDVTEENIQARMRGVLLMAISNKTGRMVLTTGNKSELAVGYATLYGDMSGGFSVLKDVYKSEVFELAHYLNRTRMVIPQHSIDKPPSAELRPDQKDSDSLPDYAVLDAILKCSIEKRMSIQDIIEEGYDAKDVERVVRLLYAAEYKRRQSAPGVKITLRAFGKDRRYPMTHAFRA